MKNKELFERKQLFINSELDQLVMETGTDRFFGLISGSLLTIGVLVTGFGLLVFS